MTEMTQYMAQIIGPVLLVLAVGLFADTGRFQRMMDKMKADDISLYLSGITILTVGVVMVLAHNLWATLPQVVVSILGWASVLKGAWLIISPQSGIEIAMKYKKNVQPLGIIMLVIGGYLTWVGFLMVNTVVTM